MRKFTVVTGLLSLSLSVFATTGKSDTCKPTPVDPDAPCFHVGSEATLHMSTSGRELMKLCEPGPDGSTQLMASGQISAKKLSKIIIEEQELGFARATAIRADAATHNTIINMKSTCDSDPDIGYLVVRSCASSGSSSDPAKKSECNGPHFLDGQAVISGQAEPVSLIQVGEAQYDDYQASSEGADGAHEFSESMTGSSVNPMTCDLVETRLCNSLRDRCRTDAQASGENWDCDGPSCEITSQQDSVDSNPVAPMHTCSVDMSLTATTIPAPVPAKTPVRKATRSFSSDKDCEKALNVFNGIHPQMDSDISMRAECDANALNVFLYTPVEHGNDFLTYSGDYSSKSDCLRAQNLLVSIGSDELTFSATHIPLLADGCEQSGSWLHGRHIFSFAVHLYGQVKAK